MFGDGQLTVAYVKGLNWFTFSQTSRESQKGKINFILKFIKLERIKQEECLIYERLKSNCNCFFLTIAMRLGLESTTPFLD